jgi:membrane protein
MRVKRPAAPSDRWLLQFWHAAIAGARGYGRHGLSQHAAAIAFRVLFSLVPLVALTVVVVDLMLPESRREEIVNWVIDQLSGSTGLEDSVRRAVEQGATAASLAGIVALAGLIWAASAMAGAIRRAFRAIWEADDSRPYVRGKLVDVGVVFGAALMVIVGFGLGIVAESISGVGGRLGSTIGIEGAGSWLATLTSNAMTLLVVFFSFAGLYRLVPTVTPRWAMVWPGALVGSVGFLVATTAYGAYLSRFGQLSAIYGSLGAVLGFLLVVWAGSIAMLLGAEIVAAWPRTWPDTRGAAGEMADNLGSHEPAAGNEP